MYKKLLAALVAALLLLVPQGLAQDADKPTIAMMGFGWFPSLK